MPFPIPITIGSLAWGTPVNDAFLDLDARVKALQLSQTSTANDQNLVAWSFDIATNVTGSVPTSGTVNMTKIWVRQPSVINNIALSIITAPVTLTAGQNFAGLYDSTGARVAVTVDQTANWATTSLKDMPLTAPYNAAAGYYYVAFVSNGATPPAFARGSSIGAGAASVNIGLTATDARYTTGPAGQTTLPVSVTLASRTISTQAWWVALR